MGRTGGSSHNESFPKIATQATLKRIVMSDKANLIFEDLQFSPDQYAQLERWRKFEDPILITLQQTQGHLPDAMGKDRPIAATVAAEGRVKVNHK